MISSPPIITSDESFSPRPRSSLSRHRDSRGASPVSMSFHNSRYSPPGALDLTPKQSALTTTANHIMSAYLPPAFAGLMSGSANSTAGLPGHGPSFGPSGKCHRPFICWKIFKIKNPRHPFRSRRYYCFGVGLYFRTSSCTSRAIVCCHCTQLWIDTLDRTHFF